MAESFLDWLLAGDHDGRLRAILDADRADRDAGITYEVVRTIDGHRVGTAPARYLAEALRDDTADALNHPPCTYLIRPVEEADNGT